MSMEQGNVDNDCNNGVARHRGSGSWRMGPTSVCSRRGFDGTGAAPGWSGGRVLCQVEGHRSATLSGVGKVSTAQRAVDQSHRPVHSPRPPSL